MPPPHPPERRRTDGTAIAQDLLVPAEGFSVIIAAHNEAAVIVRTLHSILANAPKLGRPLQVIVVANGCTDATAERARSLGDAVEVIETPVGNKIHALNLGDRAARYFPRAYVDADCTLTDNCLRCVLDTFQSHPDARLIVPEVRHLYRGRNPLLAGYYRLWRSLPYVARQTMGRGFYAIDAALHARFVEFPALTADDKFIRGLTGPDERFIARGCHTTVLMPATFRDLVRCKTRWTFGNLELAHQRPELPDPEPHAGTFRFLLLRPWHWINLPTFMLVYACSRAAARRKLAAQVTSWERDDSTRALARAEAAWGNS
jgi:glycosyltransferase involved in cell wall biosynthesis